MVGNLTPVPRHTYRVGAPMDGFWRELLNSALPITRVAGNLDGKEAEPIPVPGQLYPLSLTAAGHRVFQALWCCRVGCVGWTCGFPTCPRIVSLKAMPTSGERFERAVSIMARLRGPNGCPWDREQTFDSIKPYTLEETYEVLEAIDNRDWPELEGELGDLLLQVLFYAQMAEEEGHFSIGDVLDRLAAKLIDRHPHVFGDTTARTSDEVLRNWEALKAQEKIKRLKERGEASSDAGDADSVLAGVSSRMPGLIEAHKLSSRAARVGFDWPEIQGLFEKLEEEAEELKSELARLPSPLAAGGAGVAGSSHGKLPAELHQRLEEEVGDLFFVLVNIARYLSVDPESALRKTNRKFKRRFQWMEAELRAQGRRADQASLAELESLWQRSKNHSGESLSQR